MEYKDLVLSMYSHSEKELDAMFDSGVFNELVKGYMVMTLNSNNIEYDQVIKHLECLDTIFSEVSASEIREFCKNYCENKGVSKEPVQIPIRMNKER